MDDGKLKIKVIGIGGAGINFVNYISKKRNVDIDLVIVDTDRENLKKSKAERTILLNTGLESCTVNEAENIARRCEDQFIELLKGTDILFVISGMGGSTGTGVAPVVVEIAKKLKIFIISIVTKPFFLEGFEKLKIASIGIENIKKNTNTLMTLPNERLSNIIDFVDIEEKRKAFDTTNMIITEGILNITDMITKPGFINLDFLDIKSVLNNSLNTIIKMGTQSGDNAINSILTQVLSPSNIFESPLENAKKILISITGGVNFELQGMQKIVEEISKKLLYKDVDVIWGVMIRENYEDKVKVVVIANI